MQLCGIATIVLVCCAIQSDLWGVAAQSVIPGKFDVFNHKPLVLQSSKDDQSNKIFGFGLGGTNRAPLNDSPTSKCSCRELIVTCLMITTK